MRCRRHARLACIVAVALLSFNCVRPVEEAQKAEARADTATALSLYLGQVLKKAPGMKYPDKNESKILKSADYQKKIGDYLAWISAPSQDPIAPEVLSLLQGVDRCTASVEPVNYLIEKVSRDATRDSLSGRWRDAFFPQHTPLPPAQGAVIDEALSRSVSMITLHSGPQYSYEGSLLDRATGRRTAFSLYAENRVSFLVKPGAYLLICTSKIKFTNAEQWESPLSVVSLEVPDKSSLISAKIKTRVKRAK